MRIAVVSDIHGNLAAFEAVLNDLTRTRPDLVVHGGDLVLNGSSPAAVIDIIRDLGWPELTVANTGSVSLSYDGDPRASYLLIDNGAMSLRRVEYDIDRETRASGSSGIPTPTG